MLFRVPRARSSSELPRDRYGTGLFRVPELAVAAAHTDLSPPILLQRPDRMADINYATSVAQLAGQPVVEPRDHRPSARRSSRAPWSSSTSISDREKISREHRMTNGEDMGDSEAERSAQS